MKKAYRNIKLTLEYDGTCFFGFQKQNRRRTIQLELEKAFERIFQKPVKISSASGRTDAGVHARGQVVHFKTDSEIPIRNIHRALNTYLPEDIAVISAEEAKPNFHARFSAKRKTYQYTVWNSKVRTPLARKTSFHFPYDVNLSRIRRAARLLVGKHDFRSFQAKSISMNDQGRFLRLRMLRTVPGFQKNSSTVRTLYRLDIQKKGSELIFTVEGNGFLYNMVRNIVGTCLMVGTGQIDLVHFKKIIAAKDRKHIGFTAPAAGLSLISVKY